MKKTAAAGAPESRGSSSRVRLHHCGQAAGACGSVRERAPGVLLPPPRAGTLATDATATDALVSATGVSTHEQCVYGSGVRLPACRAAMPAAVRACGAHACVRAHGARGAGATHLKRRGGRKKKRSGIVSYSTYGS